MALVCPPEALSAALDWLSFDATRRARATRYPHYSLALGLSGHLLKCLFSHACFRKKRRPRGVSSRRGGASGRGHTIPYIRLRYTPRDSRLRAARLPRVHRDPPPPLARTRRKGYGLARHTPPHRPDGTGAPVRHLFRRVHSLSSVVKNTAPSRIVPRAKSSTRQRPARRSTNPQASTRTQPRTRAQRPASHPPTRPKRLSPAASAP